MFIDILMVLAVLILCLLVGTMFYLALNGFQLALREMGDQNRLEHEQTMAILGSLVKALENAQPSRLDDRPVLTEYTPDRGMDTKEESALAESVRANAHERLEEETLAAVLSKTTRSPVSFGAES